MGSFRRIFPFVLVLALSAVSTFAQDRDAHQTVNIETAKTSIYIGNVTLFTTPLRWSTGSYSADYRAKVFPYFFSNEKGHLSIIFSKEDLARLDHGEVVYFSGHAENTNHEERRIEGRAIPSDLKHGKIKVRVFVTPTIQLIFNSMYQFE